MAHFFTASTITYVSLTYLTDNNWDFMFEGTFVNFFVVICTLFGFCGLLTSCCEMYLSFSPAKFIRSPVLVLYLVRIMAVVESILVIAAIVTLFIPNENSIYIVKGRPALTVFCGVVVTLMVVDCITALVWLFHCWEYCPCCTYCPCLESAYCMFEPGVPGLPTAWLSL